MSKWREPPYGYENNVNNYQKALRGELINTNQLNIIHYNMDKNLINLIEICIYINPEKRPTEAEICQHPYFEGDYKKYLSEEYFNTIKTHNWYEKFRKDIELHGKYSSSFIDKNDDIFDKFF